MKSILDPKFKYVPSTHTDIRKTFARIKREQEKIKPETQRVLNIFETRRINKEK